MGIEFSESGTKIFFFSIVLLTALIAGLAASQYRNNKYLGSLLAFLSFVLLFLPLGYRAVGIDHVIYKEWYEHADYWLKANYHFTPEPLFACLTICAKDYFGEFQVIYLFSAFVYLTGVFAFLIKFKSFGYLSLFFMSISLYLYMCGLTRISIAIGITSYAFTTLDKKFKPVVLIIIAALFHYSAIITGLVFLSYNKGKNISFKYILCILIGMFSLSYIINRFAGVLPYAIMRYAGYVNLSFSFRNITSVAILLPAIVLWIFFKGGYKLLYGEKYVFYDNIVKIVFALVCLSMMFNGVFRLTFYFYPIIAKIYYDFKRVLAITNQEAVSLIYSGAFSVVGLIYMQEAFFSSPYITHLIIPFSM